jgi:hypothetical protein
MIFLDIVG